MCVCVCAHLFKNIYIYTCTYAVYLCVEGSWKDLYLMVEKKLNFLCKVTSFVVLEKQKIGEFLFNNLCFQRKIELMFSRFSMIIKIKIQMMVRINIYALLRKVCFQHYLNLHQIQAIFLSSQKYSELVSDIIIQRCVMKNLLISDKRNI